MSRISPCSSPSIETGRTTTDIRDTPSAQILIERRVEKEHFFHGGDAADVPRTDVLIERLGHMEHVAHVSDAADVPRTDVLIE
mgnify:CR=1 FL=1